ncbi:MAG: GIN domain-containing protein [Bacteroidia bacterium]
MKKPSLPFLLVLGSLLLCLVGISRAQTSLPLNGITGVSIKGPYDMVIKKGAAELKIEGTEDELQNIEISIEDGILEIGASKRRLGIGITSVNGIEISLPELHYLKLAGAGSAEVSGFNNEQLFIHMQGAASGAFDLNVSVVKIDIAGAGSLEIKGSAATVVANVSGAASVEATEYTVKDMMLNLSGAASSEVNVTQKLQVTINGIGNVVYRGKPDVVIKRIHGAGKIEEF